MLKLTIDLLKAVIKDKKYNIIKSKLTEEMQYQSPITGKIYKNYKDYLSGRNDINNNPNNEIKGAAILQTDVQPSAGNYYLVIPQKKQKQKMIVHQRKVPRQDLAIHLQL